MIYAYAKGVKNTSFRDCVSLQGGVEISVYQCFTRLKLLTPYQVGDRNHVTCYLFAEPYVV